MCILLMLATLTGQPVVVMPVRHAPPVTMPQPPLQPDQITKRT